MKTKKTIKITESNLRSLIKESINEVLNEYSTDTYGDIYNKLETSSEDPAYNERARRLKDKITQHVHDRFGITGDDIENYQADGKQESDYKGSVITRDIRNVSNKSLKGISKLRQYGISGLGQMGRKYKLR